MTWDEIRAKCLSPTATHADFVKLAEIGKNTKNNEGGQIQLGRQVTRSNGITYYWIGQPERWLAKP